MANHARATIIHELSHAVLHVPVIRRRLNSPLSGLLLARYAREKLPAYKDPEWQAWALCGSIMMPRSTIMMLGTISVPEVADTYEVSEAMARLHLKRLKLIPPGDVMGT